MTTTNMQSSGLPLALHLRRLRQWHGDRELAQETLARYAGVATRQLALYERTTDLPEPLRTMLALAYALNVSVEELIAPDLLQSIQDDVDDRRCDEELRQQRRARAGHDA